MMAAHLLRFLFVTLQQSQPVQLLFVSDFYAHQVSAARTGQTWFGLFHQGAGWEIAPTTIRVDSISSGCMQNGRRIAVDRAGHPLFLVRGVPQLHRGPVAAVAPFSPGLRPSSPLEFQFENAAFQLAAAGGDTSYTLRVVRVADGRSQELVSYHGHAQMAWSAKVLWVGTWTEMASPTSSSMLLSSRFRRQIGFCFSHVPRDRVNWWGKWQNSGARCANECSAQRAA